MILQCIVRLLSADDQFDVVGTALTATGGIAVCKKVHPDVVIIDYTLPDMDAPRAIQVILHETPLARIITLSGSERPGAFYASQQAGSSAWVRKTRAIQELRDAVVDVARGRPVLSEEVVSVPSLSELVLHYQPIIKLENERLAGFEALVRWQHPTRGLLSPNSFLPLAEASGFIVEIDKWSLEQAALQLKKWQAIVPLPVPLWMSVNASVSNFFDRSYFDLVSGPIANMGLSRDTLVVELTESVLLENSDPSLQLLLEMRERGLGLALDDFGTAFSSLSYLRRFPFSHLKIDCSFTEEVLTSTRTLLLIEEICHMSRTMGMRSIAEGIEHREQIGVLRSVGCEFGQGYLISRPIPAHQCERLLLDQLEMSS
jgi:EAL domain-containing protein (putative c-di-GMP-specific phosphodiesterase class I)